MHSIIPESGDGALIDDRTTKARIRDAAIDCFAEHGVAATTARKVATAAGVSPGLVIHHFGSMDGLRSACDHHVAAVIRRQESAAMSTGPDLDLLAFLRDGNVGPIAGYLARILAEDSPAVASLVDDLVADAEGYMQRGVEAGVLRPSADPRSRAIVLTMWSLGTLVLHRHLHRLLGVDLTDPDFGADPSIAAYVGPVYEIYGEGILTEAFATRARAAFAGIAGQDQQEERAASEESS